MLLALLDAYKYIAVDLGGYGHNSYSGIYSCSPCGQMLEVNALNVPNPKVLPGGSTS